MHHKWLFILTVIVVFAIMPVIASAQFDASDSQKPQTATKESTIKGSDIGTPRIVVVPDANAPQLSAYGRAAAREIIGELSRQHFMVVNASQIQQLHDEVHAMMKVNTLNEATTKIGLKYSAEIVMALEVTHRIKGFDQISKQAAASGVVAGQVYETTTGQILYDGSFSNDMGSGSSEQEAAEAALKSAAKQFSAAVIPEILSWWSEKATSGKNYTVRLWKVTNPEEVNVFKKTIESTPGCTNVVQRSVSIEPGSPNNFAEMTVFYKGPLDEFQEAILQTLKQNQAFSGLAVRSSKGDQIDFTLQ